MDQTRQELEQKAAKYRQLARQVADKLTVDRIFALAEELEQQAKQKK